LTTTCLHANFRAMNKPLYSIRMHATLGGRHLSGAERLAGEAALEELTAALVRRALQHPRGKADELRLTVEAVDPAAIRYGRLPDVRTVPVTDWRQGRTAALLHLLQAGVSENAAAAAMTALAAGAAPGGVSMRGAMLVDAASGKRLEADQGRGVRVSRADLTPNAETELRQQLQRRGLDNEHVREALVLAAKVLLAPGIVAELCWSDDPDYTAGYVATPPHSYTRFPHLKPAGEERGGRAFFLRREGLDLEKVKSFLERQVLLFDAAGILHAPTEAEE
jgi:6-carboxyhexanoate--CoA ligase